MHVQKGQPKLVVKLTTYATQKRQWKNTTSSIAVGISISNHSPMINNFQVSMGWFTDFTKQSNLHDVKNMDDPASEDHVMEESYSDGLKKFTNEKGYFPQQAFNINEKCTFWRRMSAST
jgi:hypothetical protein